MWSNALRERYTIKTPTEFNSVGVHGIQNVLFTGHAAAQLGIDGIEKILGAEIM